MSKIICKIRTTGAHTHTDQIMAGLEVLEKQNIIKLEFEIVKDKKDYIPEGMLEVIINNKLRILYDLNDGYDNRLKQNESYEEFYNKLLVKYDICFKRSFSSEYNSKLINKNKIYPLGLNYGVKPAVNKIEGSILENVLDKNFNTIAKRVMGYNKKFLIESFEYPPMVTDNPKVLFMARLWEPSHHNKHKSQEREYINQTRIACMRSCKEELKDNFIGGFQSSKYAEEICPELIIRDKKITQRANYIKIMKQSSICIATMGLHESIGWKFAEYIAASKAIVSEKLHYELPGEILKDINYIEFSNPNECISSIRKLLENKNYLYQMQKANYEYYHKYVRPDRLVLNSILLAINKLDI